MILLVPAGLCLGYFFVCGARYGFYTSLLWGWTVAAAYFAALAFLPPPWQKIGLTPFVLYLVFLALFLRKSPGKDAGENAQAYLLPGSRADGALPRAFLHERAEKLAQRYRARPAPVVISGGRVGRETEAEAVTLRGLLTKRGVPDEAIRTEEQSVTTWENLLCSAPLLEGVTRLTVVTHAFHRRRLLALARRALPGKEIAFARADGKTGLLTLHLYLRESFTFLADLLRGRAAL